MSPENDLIEQGIAAYEAGDIDKARELLAEGTKQQPENELGWLYLAKTQTDATLRREYLEKVLDINPDNIEVSAMLAMMHLEDDLPMDEPASAPATAFKPPLISARPNIRLSASAGFAIPPGIPGAPERLTLDELRTTYETTAQQSVNVFMDKPGAVNLAALNWWDLLLLTATIGLLTGIALVISQILVSVRQLNILSLFTIPLLTTLTSVIAVGAGCFLSHWYLANQANGKASLLSHSASLVAVWFPASIINIIVIFFEVMLGGRVITLEMLLLGQIGSITGGSILATVAGGVVALYTLYLMLKQLSFLYVGVLQQRLVTAAALMLIVTAIIF